MRFGCTHNHAFRPFCESHALTTPKPVVAMLMNHSGYHCIIHWHLVYRNCHLSWFVLSHSPTTIRTYSLHSTVTTSTVPAITSCYRNSRSVDFSILFLLLFVFALGMSLGTGSIHYRYALIKALPSVGLTYTHTCHAELADSQRPSARRLGDAQYILLYM
jgi:hypothetical protein